MKKIIVGIAIAMCSIVATAASVEWSAEGIYAYGSASLAENYLVYYFDTANLTTDALSTALAGGDYSFLSKGYAADDMESGEAVGNASGYENGGAVNGYLVVFNADTTDAATFAFVSGIETGSIGIAGQSPTLGFDLSSSATAANWTAVPEPTSGLLLLLGMAGLALKRKRA